MAREDWYNDGETVLEELRKARLEHLAIPSIDGYRDLVEISRGGQGVVFGARREVDERPVAIKVLGDGVLASEQRRVRFEREAELVTTLRHEHIARVLDHGRTGEGLSFLVMELIEGEPFDVLAGRVRGEVDGERRVIAVFLQVCEAVAFAHQRGVIHRDIKPGNILVDDQGCAHVLDFGLAKALTAAPGITSASGRFLGSLPWTSPEQADGRLSDVDVRSDVYSLGVVLYEALTGELPYDVREAGLRDALNRVARAPATRPARLGVRGDLETILLRCLEKEPGRRYQHVSDLIIDLRHVLEGEPIEAQRERAWQTMQRTIRRYRLAIGVAAGVILLLGAFGVTSAALFDRARSAEVLAAARLRDVTDAAARTAAINDVLERVLDGVRLEGAAPSLEMISLLEEAALEYEGSTRHDPEVEARMRYAIGHAYAMLAEDERAEPHLRRALMLSRQVHGDDHPDVAACLARLGDVLAGRPEGASLQEEALRIRRAHFGSEHVEVARSLGGLAYSSWVAGSDMAQAEALYLDAIEMYERLPGDHRRELARCLHGYAEMCAAQERWGEARDIYERALGLLAGSRRDDPFRLECMASAATLLGRMRHSAQAERLYLELAEDAPLAYGERVRPRFLWRAGSMRVDQDDPDGAEALFSRAIAAECRVVAKADPQRARRLNELAEAIDTGSAGEGRAYAEALALLREAAGVDSAMDSVLLRELGLSLLALGRPEEAVTVLRDGHGIAVALAGEDNPALTQCKGALGICLARLGMFEEAEALLMKSYRLGQSPTHATSWHERLALRRLHELYALWGRDDQARQIEARLAALDGAG